MENILDHILDTIPADLALQADLAGWADAILVSGRAHPGFTATLLILAIATGLAGRSLSLLLVGLAIALESVWLIDRTGTGFRLVDLQLVTLLQMLLLLLGAWSWRRHLYRLRKREAALRTEQTELRFLLDREIVWRTAAQPTPRPIQASEVSMNPVESRPPGAPAALGLAPVEG